MKRPKHGTLISVELDDIEHSKGGWMSTNAIAKERPSRYRCVGWVARTTRRTLTLTSMVGVDPPGGYCHYLLPWGAVRRWKRLKP